MKKMQKQGKLMANTMTFETQSATPIKTCLFLLWRTCCR